MEDHPVFMSYSSRAAAFSMGTIALGLGNHFNEGNRLPTNSQTLISHSTEQIDVALRVAVPCSGGGEVTDFRRLVIMFL
ncbi:MAG: hypothetical protein JWR14_5563 [Caballeronia sp.]|jgi:hypothetical protein|nr:hypothetical protein [Caballeronia sp.]